MNEASLAIGRLGSPKGVRGDLKVHSYSGETDHFFKLKEVALRAAGSAEGELRLKVARMEGSGESLTIAFEGYSSPEAARKLTGMDIVVPRSGAAALGPNEWYIADLVGLALVSGGAKVATVRSVLEGGPDPWLEVVQLPAAAERTPEGAKRTPEGVSLVPFRKEFVGEVDVAGGTIELLAPELLEP